MTRTAGQRKEIQPSPPPPPLVGGCPASRSRARREPCSPFEGSPGTIQELYSSLAQPSRGPQISHIKLSVASSAQQLLLQGSEGAWGIEHGEHRASSTVYEDTIASPLITHDAYIAISTTGKNPENSPWANEPRPAPPGDFLLLSSMSNEG